MTITRTLTITVTADPQFFDGHAASEDFHDDLIHLLENAESVSLIRATNPDGTDVHTDTSTRVAVHIGVKTTRRRSVGIISEKSPAGVGVHLDGDGWAEWGEPVANGVNAWGVHHAVLTGPRDTVMGLLRDNMTDEDLLTSEQGYANPLDCPAEWRNNRIVVTETDDWSRVIATHDAIPAASH